MVCKITRLTDRTLSLGLSQAHKHNMHNTHKRHKPRDIMKDLWDAGWFRHPPTTLVFYDLGRLGVETRSRHELHTKAA